MEDDDFVNHLEFSNKVTLHLNEKVNHHNITIWSTEQPNSVERERNSPKLNVFAAIFETKMYGPFFSQRILWWVFHTSIWCSYACFLNWKMIPIALYSNKVGSASLACWSTRLPEWRTPTPLDCAMYRWWLSALKMAS